MPELAASPRAAYSAPCGCKASRVFVQRLLQPLFPQKDSSSTRCGIIPSYPWSRWPFRAALRCAGHTTDIPWLMTFMKENKYISGKWVGSWALLLPCPLAGLQVGCSSSTPTPLRKQHSPSLAAGQEQCQGRAGPASLLSLQLSTAICKAAQNCCFLFTPHGCLRLTTLVFETYSGGTGTVSFPPAAAPNVLRPGGMLGICFAASKGLSSSSECP